MAKYVSPEPGDYGVVCVMRGPHKGRMGFYDDDDMRLAIVYFGYPCMSSNAEIRRSWLRVATPEEEAEYRADHMDISTPKDRTVATLRERMLQSRAQRPSVGLSSAGWLGLIMGELQRVAIAIDRLQQLDFDDKASAEEDLARVQSIRDEFLSAAAVALRAFEEWHP